MSPWTTVFAAPGALLFLLISAHYPVLVRAINSRNNTNSKGVPEPCTADGMTEWPRRARGLRRERGRVPRHHQPSTFSCNHTLISDW
jgi:hypothetical protein